MPHTINGIGTWYWGKRNVNVRRGTCEFCDNLTTLTSYDTTLYFVLVYLPIVPLKKKRVIGECAVCHKHRAADLAKWNAARDQDIAAAMDAFEQSPTNVEAAEKALGTAMAYEDEQAFTGLAELIESHLPQDPDVQAMLGEGFRFFGRSDEAVAAFRASLKYRDDPRVRRALAVQLMVTGRPDDARPLVADLLSQHQESDVGLCYLLVESYQSQGMHVQALALLDEWGAAIPALQQNKDFLRYRKVSQRGQTKGNAVVSANIQRTGSGGGRDKTALLAGRFAKWFAPALLVLGLLGYMALCYSQGTNRAVYVVNGLDAQYTVKIGDQSVVLRPNGRQLIHVSEGDLQLQVNDPDYHIEPATVSISTPFWTRAFSNRTFIINPDRTALITWELTYYAPQGQSAPQGDGKVQVGSNLYEFSGINYHFTDFPASISMSSDQSAAKRTRVATLQIKDPLNAPDTIEHYCGREAATQYIKLKLQQQPRGHDTVIWLSMLQDRMEPEQFVDFCRSMLSERPVLLHFHRGYQEVQQQLHPEYDLEGEYAGYVAKEPDKAELIYLRGRVAKDRARQIQLFNQAADAKPPCALAINALAWDAMVTGDFDRAVTLSKRADQLQPGDIVIHQNLIENLMASKDYDELIALLAKALRANPHDSVARIQRMQVAILAGRQTDAQRIITENKQYFLDQYGQEAAAVTDKQIDAQASYARGQADAYVRIARQIPNSAMYWTAEVTAGSWKSAAPLLDKVEEPSSWDHMLMAIGAMTVNDQALADQQFAKAVEQLRAGTRDDRQLADMLSDARSYNLQDALTLSLRPDDKRVALTLLGLKYAQDKQALFDLARKLNYLPTFPKLTLDKILQ